MKVPVTWDDKFEENKEDEPTKSTRIFKFPIKLAVWLSCMGLFKVDSYSNCINSSEAAESSGIIYEELENSIL